MASDVINPAKLNANIIKFFAQLAGGKTKWVFSSQSSSGATQDTTGLIFTATPAWPSGTPVWTQLKAVSPNPGVPLTPAQITALGSNPAPQGTFNSLWAMLTNNGAGWGTGGSAAPACVLATFAAYCKCQMTQQAVVGGSGAATATGIPSDVEFYPTVVSSVATLDANGNMAITMDSGPLFNAAALEIGDATTPAQAVYAIWSDHTFVS